MQPYLSVARPAVGRSVGQSVGRLDPIAAKSHLARKLFCTGALKCTLEAKVIAVLSSDRDGDVSRASEFCLAGPLQNLIFTLFLRV